MLYLLDHTEGAIIVRSLLIIVVLFLFAKIVGKKQLSQLSFFEYISGITTGGVAAEVIMGFGHILHGILSIIIFTVVTYLVNEISLKNKKIGEILEGKSVMIIKDGEIIKEKIKKEKYSLDEILSLLRQKNVFNVDDVELGILEPNGELSVLLKKEKRPITQSTSGAEQKKQDR